MRSIAAHQAGPQLIAPHGTVTHGGVRALRLRADRTTLLSGGADGAVLSWAVTEGGDVGQQVHTPPSHRVSLTVSHTVSRTVSPTVSPTVSLTVSLTVSPTVSPTVSLTVSPCAYL